MGSTGVSMRQVILGGILAAMAAVSGPGTAQAEQIRRACLTSERSINPRLCTCIQQAANRTLTSRDQRRAAGFFKDPDEAEKVRMSKRRGDEAFWQRYKAFGAFAASACS